MKLRLHEIEYGVHDLIKSGHFYMNVLGLKPVVENNRLIVFDSNNSGVDFNVSKHLPAGKILASFITDDLEQVMAELRAAHISYNGPFATHLAMQCIELKDPDGNLIRINAVI